jgi:hypothetical protein
VSLLKESSERQEEERLAEGRLVDLSLDSGLQVFILYFFKGTVSRDDWAFDDMYG